MGFKGGKFPITLDDPVIKCVSHYESYESVAANCVETHSCNAVRTTVSCSTPAPSHILHPSHNSISHVLRDGDSSLGLYWGLEKRWPWAGGNP